MPLTRLSHSPHNAEAALPDLGAPVTPVEHFYVRSNFPAPDIRFSDWKLPITGCVERTITIDRDALQAMPFVTRRVTLECAGNGRRLMTPVPPGTSWLLGAASTAVFGGVALRDVLALAGIRPDAIECVFTGADRGPLAGQPTSAPSTFARSLPVAHAVAPDPMIAWTMNGAPLTRDHGFPVRLVVPNFYAVASVKWLIAIEAVRAPFRGHFQASRYVYRLPGAPDEPVTLMRVRSLVTSPTDGATVPAGDVLLTGVAWSGHGAVRRVEVVDGSGCWHDADVEDGPAGAAVAWRCRIPIVPGPNVVRCRASDASGAIQPLEPVWNALGYGNNVAHAVTLTGR